MSTNPFEVVPGYHDALGRWHEMSPQTRLAVEAALGSDADRIPRPALRVVASGESVAVPRGELVLEDGTVLPVERSLPPDMPLGYHEFRAGEAEMATRVIVAPQQCFLPAGLRIWGWSVQLYAARSLQSWGIGDLADLRQLARWSAELGAGILQLNPLPAVAPVVPQDISPYYPSSRCFRNPLYLRVEEVPGAADALPELERLASMGRALNQDRRIDRDAVFRHKYAALELLCERFSGDPDFDAFRAEQGELLSWFATFCTLAERFGRDWRRWPAEYYRPEGAAVARFVSDNVQRVRFHEWLQWLFDRQLASASAEIRLLRDLPVGIDPGGVDAWTWQEIVAADIGIGAPPDQYSAEGQNWGLAPFSPRRLQAAGYEPFIQTLRAKLRHAGGLRIDHVMGLFRQFWVPSGLSASQGAFVRYPVEDLLAIVALESHRARAVIVGEDLGTVEPGVRERLAAARILSCRLLWFEEGPSDEYPELALASIGTHDLPTITGLWSGSDLREMQRLNRLPDEVSLLEMRQHLRRMTGLAEDSPVEQVIKAAYRILAKAPAVIVTASLEDALAVGERPNIPGTVSERPNWSLGLPVTLEELERAPLARSIGEALSRRST